MLVGVYADDDAYLRVMDGPEGMRVLEVAIRDLRPRDGAEGPRLRLVGVTHIGEKDYYARLQQMLDQADLVLYEGIGGDTEAFRNPAPPDPDSANLQEAMARALGLDFQLHAIRYNRPHFVNSDLPLLEFLALLQGEEWEELSEEGRERFRQLLTAMEGRGFEANVLQTLLAHLDREPRIRSAAAWVLVEILGVMRGDMTQYRGLPRDMQEMLHVLLQRRNDVVIRDVAEAFSRETPPREIAVFYGAAHLHDLEKRLRAAHDLELADVQWLPAFRGSLHGAGLNSLQKAIFQSLMRYQLHVMGRMMRESP